MNGVIDLNADIGESYGLMRSGQDELISPHVTSVNIATGFHSGDPDSIKKTVGSGTDYPFDQLGDADSELTIVSGT